MVDEFLRQVLVVETARRLLEGLSRIGREHVSPQVAVVAGRVALAGEDVAEMRASVSHDDSTRHAQLRQCFALERVGIDACRVGGVVLHVHERGSEIFRCLEALVERRSLLDLRDELLRDRLARFMVNEVRLDHRVRD